MEVSVKPRIAVVGGGIAGISAAYRLRQEADVTLFEALDTAGGHAHTVQVTDAGRTIGLDTAFIVFNEQNYPRITNFFAELGVATQNHPGKFCFFDRDRQRFYVSDDLELDVEQAQEKYDPEFVRLHAEAARFYRESPRHFLRKQTDIPLGEYLDAHGYSDEFRYGFIVLIATAAWSVPADRIWQMPASTIVAFFMAHGGEGLGGRRAPWLTVTGGSISYVNAALAAIERDGGRALLNTPVHEVRQEVDGVVVGTSGGSHRFDYVIVATHADDAMRIVRSPSRQQARLRAIEYNTTDVALHTDAACMIAERSAWRSWNYGKIGAGPDTKAWVVYYLNSLHEFTSDTDYFLTLDYPDELKPESVIKRFKYRHPVITTEVRTLQREIRDIAVTPDSRIAFAGSYIHSRKLGVDIIGSHESGFDSGLAAAEAVLRKAGNHE